MLKVTLLNSRMIARLLPCSYSAGAGALTATTNRRRPSLSQDIWTVSMEVLALYQPLEFLLISARR